MSEYFELAKKLANEQAARYRAADELNAALRRDTLAEFGARVLEILHMADAIDSERNRRIEAAARSLGLLSREQDARGSVDDAPASSLEEEGKA